MSNLNFFRVMQASNFDAQSIPCNAGDVSFSGGAGYYVATAVVIGEGIGPVTASFNSLGVPDQFQLYWSGSVVADSLMVGDNLVSSATYNFYTGSYGNVSNLTRYDYDFSTDSWTTGSAQSVNYTSASFPPYSIAGVNGDFTRDKGETLSQTSLEAEYRWMLYATSSIHPGHKIIKPGTSIAIEKANYGGQLGVNPDFPTISAPGGAFAGDGNVQLKFFKHTKFPTTFDIIIQGPANGTAWSLTELTCPTENSVNSSSIQGLPGGFSVERRTIYHHAPTFDLRPGMKVYFDANLTQPVTGSYTEFATLPLISGSFPTNPPSTGPISNAANGYAFANTPIAGAPNPYLTIYSGSDADLQGFILTCSAYPDY